MKLSRLKLDTRSNVMFVLQQILRTFAVSATSS